MNEHEVNSHEATFDEARLHCEALARDHGYRYIRSGDEPLQIAGVATETLGMLKEQPDLEVLIVPVGGGSGAAGAGCGRPGGDGRTTVGSPLPAG